VCSQLCGIHRFRVGGKGPIEGQIEIGRGEHLKKKKVHLLIIILDVYSIGE